MLQGKTYEGSGNKAQIETRKAVSGSTRELALQRVLTVTQDPQSGRPPDNTT
jgi:hypothetical protein